MRRTKVPILEEEDGKVVYFKKKGLGGFSMQKSKTAM